MVIKGSPVIDLGMHNIIVRVDPGREIFSVSHGRSPFSRWNPEEISAYSGTSRLDWLRYENDGGEPLLNRRLSGSIEDILSLVFSEVMRREFDNQYSLSSFETEVATLHIANFIEYYFLTIIEAKIQHQKAISHIETLLKELTTEGLISTEMLRDAFDSLKIPIIKARNNSIQNLIDSLEKRIFTTI